MAALPARSPGVLLSGSTTAVALDLVAETLHRLNTTGHALLDRCDGRTQVDEVARAWGAASGAPVEVVRDDIETALAAFVDLGLVGRTDPAPAPRLLGEAPDAADRPHHGILHPVVGHAIRLSGDDLELLELLDRHLGPGADGEATRRFTIDEQPDGSLRFVADSTWVFPSRVDLLDQVTTAINEYGHDSPDVVTLHAAAVVSPDGRRVLLPAVSGSGKSTLAAHLISAGWDYLGDESIGVRAGDLALLPYPKPLALDPTSREAVGLPASARWTTAPEELRAEVVVHTRSPGPVDLVVLPTYDDPAPFATDRLDPTTALEALAANALNLAATGQAGFTVLDAVATGVPVHRVTHHDARAVEDWLRSR